MALDSLTGLTFDVYVWVSETDVVALLFAYVLWSDVARWVSLDEVIGSKETACNCVAEDDVEILVEFVAVTDVVIRDEVAFSVVKSICCRWCVVLIPVVSKDSVTDGSVFLVKFLLSKCKKKIFFLQENNQNIPLFIYKKTKTKTSPGYELGRSCVHIMLNPKCIFEYLINYQLSFY